MMPYPTFVEMLQDELHRRVFAKTGWGCNQLWGEIQAGLVAALARAAAETPPVMSEPKINYGEAKGKGKKK
jgi:hypothetical protein